MKDNELKECVVNLCNEMGVKSTISLFEGIVSQSTIYKWHNQKKKIKSLEYKYTVSECLREFEILKSYYGNNSSYDSTPHYNKIVLTHQPHFYSKENELYKDDLIREKLIQNRTKYLFKSTFNDKELLRGFKISGIHTGYSHFSPVWLMKFIENYNIKSIYDPCGGWGHRLLGALVSNIDYIYNDIWEESVDGVRNILTFLRPYTNCVTRVKLYNTDCTKFTPSGSYQCVFTCPPYFNVEQYSQPPFNNIDQYKKFIENMIGCSTNSSTSNMLSVNIMGIVISGKYSEIIINAANKYGFKLNDTHTLKSTQCVSHFNKTTSKKSEVLLVFQR